MKKSVQPPNHPSPSETNLSAYCNDDFEVCAACRSECFLSECTLILKNLERFLRRTLFTLYRRFEFTRISSYVVSQYCIGDKNVQPSNRLFRSSASHLKNKIPNQRIFNPQKVIFCWLTTFIRFVLKVVLIKLYFILCIERIVLFIFKTLQLVVFFLFIDTINPMFSLPQKLLRRMVV